MNHWMPLGLNVTLVVNFVKIAPMLANLDFLEKNILSIFWHRSLHMPENLHNHLQNFDKDARPIFLGLKFGQILFFWVGKFFSYFFRVSQNFRYFFGSDKFPAIFWFFQFLYHTLNEEYTVLKNKIIVAFHIYSNFDSHCILSHSIFLGLNFGAFYFLGS